MLPLNIHWRSRVSITSSVYHQGSLRLACPKNASYLAEGALQSAACGRPRSVTKIPTSKWHCQARSLDASEKRFWMPIKKTCKLCTVKQSNTPQQHSSAGRKFLV